MHIGAHDCLTHEIDEPYVADIVGLNSDAGSGRIGEDRDGTCLTSLADAKEGDLVGALAAATIASDRIVAALLGANGDALGRVAGVPNIVAGASGFEQEALSEGRRADNFNMNLRLRSHKKREISSGEGIGE